MDYSETRETAVLFGCKTCVNVTHDHTQIFIKRNNPRNVGLLSLYNKVTPICMSNSTGNHAVRDGHSLAHQFYLY